VFYRRVRRKEQIPRFAGDDKKGSFNNPP
jgi:hypothetical protein